MLQIRSTYVFAQRNLDPDKREERLKSGGKFPDLVFALCPPTSVTGTYGCSESYAQKQYLDHPSISILPACHALLSTLNGICK